MCNIKQISFRETKFIFPYEWLDSIDKPNETSLQPKKVFYSKLKQSGITFEEYKQALGCWNESGCETIKEYMMSYLKTDEFLPLDVFEKLRDICLECYEIDPCYT